MVRTSTRQKMLNSLKKHRKTHRNQMKGICNSLDSIFRNIEATQSSDENPEKPDNDSNELKEASKGLRKIAEIIDPTKPVIQLINKKRYLFRDKKYLARKAIQLQKFNEFWNYNDEDFRTYVRMNHGSFEKLHHLIKSCKEYTSRQTPVKMQMCVVLERFGSYGNGSDLGKLARKWGFSSKLKSHIRSLFSPKLANWVIIIEGSVDRFTSRFIEAVLTYEKLFLTWPNEEERVAISKRNDVSHGFAGCVGFIDGSVIKLAYTPTWRHEDFFCHKQFSGIQNLAICDDKRRIRLFETGYMGSSHDMRLLSQSNFLETIDQKITDDQYVLGDAGFSQSDYIVAVSKKPRNGELSKEDITFNNQIARLRVRIEHAFGILKERFQSLKELRIFIQSENDLIYASSWIRACVVLNLFLMDQQGEDEILTDRLRKKMEKKMKKLQKKFERSMRKLERDEDESHNNEQNDEETIEEMLLFNQNGAEKRKVVKQMIITKLKSKVNV